MTNPKPVELTEAERESLDCMGMFPTFENEVLRRVGLIVAAREAAARREAEDDPAHARMYRALVERAERAEAEVAAARRDGEMRSAALWYAERAKVERVEALADRWERINARISLHLSGVEVDPAHEVRAAIAEPERDEESGR